MMTATTANKAHQQMPISVEDHEDFKISLISPGDRFDLTIATQVYRDVEFCGLWTEQSAGIGQLAIVGMKFRVGGDSTMPLRWSEIESLQPLE